MEVGRYQIAWSISKAGRLPPWIWRFEAKNCEFWGLELFSLQFQVEFTVCSFQFSVSVDAIE